MKTKTSIETAQVFDTIVEALHECKKYNDIDSAIKNSLRRAFGKYMIANGDDLDFSHVLTDKTHYTHVGTIDIRIEGYNCFFSINNVYDNDKTDFYVYYLYTDCYPNQR